ncbi:unnamed protein product, partial [Ectocarpus fasciculatus]
CQPTEHRWWARHPALVSRRPPRSPRNPPCTTPNTRPRGVTPSLRGTAAEALSHRCRPLPTAPPVRHRDTAAAVVPLNHRCRLPCTGLLPVRGRGTGALARHRLRTGPPNLEHRTAALKQQRRGGTTPLRCRQHRRTAALLKHRQRRTAALESPRLRRRRRRRRGTGPFNRRLRRRTAAAATRHHHPLTAAAAAWVPGPVRRSETRTPCTTVPPPAAAARRLCPAAAVAAGRDLAAAAILESGRRRHRPCRSSGVPRRRLRRRRRRLRLRRNTRRLGVPQRRSTLPARPHPTMRLRHRRLRRHRRRRPQHRQRRRTRTAAVPTATAAAAVVPMVTAAIRTPTAAAVVVGVVAEARVLFLSPQAGKRRPQATDGRFSSTTIQDQPTGSGQFERKPSQAPLPAFRKKAVVQEGTARSPELLCAVSHVCLCAVSSVDQQKNAMSMGIPPAEGEAAVSGSGSLTFQILRSISERDGVVK